MGFFKNQIQGLKEFYFRPGPHIGLTIATWIYYLVASMILLFIAGRGLYGSIVARDGLYFFFITWLLLFFWLWGGSLRLYPAIWDDTEYTYGRKFTITLFIVFAHVASILAYYWSKRFFYDLPEDFSFTDLLTFLNSPIVLVVLGIIFLIFLKIKQNFPAVFIWCCVCFYHLFKLLPEKSGEAITDMRTLLIMMGSTNLLIFAGGIIGVFVAAFYIYYMGD